MLSKTIFRLYFLVRFETERLIMSEGRKYIAKIYYQLKIRVVMPLCRLYFRTQNLYQIHAKGH